MSLSVRRKSDAVHDVAVEVLEPDTGVGEKMLCNWLVRVAEHLNERDKRTFDCRKRDASRFQFLSNGAVLPSGLIRSNFPD
jgi:hypothetical protein